MLCNKTHIYKKKLLQLESYNDTGIDGTQIFAWPTKMIVAARSNYTTRIPLSASKEVKDQARAKFF